jgi:neutral ceramidase
VLTKTSWAYIYNIFFICVIFLGENNTEIGLINWYSVHGTSMNNTNYFISGDNKGYAMYDIIKHD